MSKANSAFAAIRPEPNQGLENGGYIQAYADAIRHLGRRVLNPLISEMIHRKMVPVAWVESDDQSVFGHEVYDAYKYGVDKRTIASFRRSELLKAPNIGPHSVRKISAWLEVSGLHLRSEDYQTSQ